MITLITGRPGQGKSYFAVYRLLKDNFDFKLMKFKEDVIVFTNLEGLKIPYYPLPQRLNEDFLKRIRQKTLARVYIIIDEAQNYLRNVKANSDEGYFLQIHRHYGVDITLITQTKRALPAYIQDLVDWEIRMKKINNIFVAEYFFQDERIKREIIKFDPKIAYMYESFRFEGSNVQSLPLQRLILSLILVFLFSTAGFLWFLHTFADLGEKEKIQPAKVEKPQLPSPEREDFF